MTGRQSHKGWKRAITAQEKHYLPKCKQASLLTKTSEGSGQSSSAWEGTPAVHPENWAAETGKVISRSNCTRQTPDILGPGRPNRICTSEGYLSAEPERLRPGRCMRLRASLRRFPVEQRRAWALCTASRSRPSGAEKLWAHASVICLQHPSLPTVWLNKCTLKKKKCPPLPPLCVRAEIRHWRDQQTEEAKTEGTTLEVTGAID